MLTAENPLILNVSSDTKNTPSTSELQLNSEESFERLEKDFRFEVTNWTLVDADPEDKLFEGPRSIGLTIENDDVPPPTDYPSGVLRRPTHVSNGQVRVSLGHWTFDTEEDGGFSFTPQSIDLNNGMAQNDAVFSGAAQMATGGDGRLLGLPTLVRDRKPEREVYVGHEYTTLYWIESSNAVKNDEIKFTVSVDTHVISFIPQEVQFYSTQPVGGHDWELSWSVDGTNYATITTSADTVPSLRFDGYDKFNVTLPVGIQIGNVTHGLLGEPVTFRLTNKSNRDWQIDNFSVLGKRINTVEQFSDELKRFLEQMDYRLPYNPLINEAGPIHVSIGPRFLSPVYGPVTSVIVDVLGSDSTSTINLADVAVGAPGSPELPMKLTTAGDVRYVDTRSTTFLGSIFIGGDVVESTYTGDVYAGSSINATGELDWRSFGRPDVPRPNNRPGEGETQPAPLGTYVSAGTLRHLEVHGDWLSGSLQAEHAGTLAINGTFAADVQLQRGFDTFSVLGGDFAPPSFQTGLAGNGDSGQLLVVDGDLLNTVSINGAIDRIHVRGGDLNATLHAGQIGRLVTVADGSRTAGGNLNGEIVAGSVDEIFVTGGNLNSRVTTTDASHAGLEITVASYAGAGGSIRSPGSLHIAGGVRRISASRVDMGLHVGGGVEEIVVTPTSDGRRGLLSGNFDAARFGLIRAVEADLDVDVYVKQTAAELGARPGIERVELDESYLVHTQFHLPPDVTAGEFVVDGRSGAWGDPESLPVADGYRVEVFEIAGRQNALVIPAGWQNPRVHVDVNDDGFVTPGRRAGAGQRSEFQRGAGPGAAVAVDRPSSALLRQ